MPTAQDLLQIKGSAITTIGPGVTVYDAAVTMNEHKIGSLVVTADGRIVGMFTERDILRRVVAQKRDPATTLVQEVMSTSVVCCQLGSSLDEVSGVMKNRRIRHLPVVDAEDKLIGLISIGDLNAFYANSQEQTIHMLREYIGGHA